MWRAGLCFFVFFFSDTATTEIYTLSLHDALPISSRRPPCRCRAGPGSRASPDRGVLATVPQLPGPRSEEHTSELQSRQYLVCRLLLEKKKEAQRQILANVTTSQRHSHQGARFDRP